ncbi:MAG TPA: hypothetical protein DIW81_17495 [Planctomycetaceae bacterium]|nr:hypothetical protein [Rubinisphaera sp.]HCS53358.1 hypothetical protein [Planctomycetaceae bacterium]
MENYELISLCISTLADSDIVLIGSESRYGLEWLLVIILGMKRTQSNLCDLSVHGIVHGMHGILLILRVECR